MTVDDQEWHVLKRETWVSGNEMDVAFQRAYSAAPTLPRIGAVCPYSLVERSYLWNWYLGRHCLANHALKIAVDPMEGQQPRVSR